MIYIFIAVSIMLWASVFVGIRAVLAAYNPFEVAVLRFIISSVILLLFAFIGKIQIPDKRDFVIFFVLGLVLFLNYITLNYGARTLTAGETNLIVSTSQIFQVIFAWLFLKEIVSVKFIIGLIFSFSGVALITIENSAGFSLNKGIIFVLIAAVTNAVFFILQKLLLKKYRPIEVVSFAIWIAAILMLPFGKSLIEKIQFAKINYTFIIIYIGVSAVIANLCWSAVLSKIEASKAAIILYSIPVMTIIFGFLWLNELPSLLSCLGGSIILFGVFFSNLKPKNENHNIVNKHYV